MNKYDLILFLRNNFSKNKLPVLEDNKYLIINNKKVSITEESNWKPINSDKKYKICDLYLFLKYRLLNLKPHEYIQDINSYKAKGIDCQMISLNHQDDIENYFFSKNEESNYIQSDLNIVFDKRENKIKGNIILNENEIEILQLTRQKEKILKTKNSELKVNKDFGYIIKMLESSGRNESTTLNKKKNQTNLEYIISNNNGLEAAKPIIFIPNKVIPGNLHCGNIKDLLINGVYNINNDNYNITHQKAFFEIVQVINGKPICFEITDDISFIKNRRKIDYVVAILINGDIYQFIDTYNIWGEQNTAKLFKKIKAYYFCYEDTKLDNVIKSWNIKILKINRTERHKDKVIKKIFWDDLTIFLNSIKSYN